MLKLIKRAPGSCPSTFTLFSSGTTTSFAVLFAIPSIVSQNWQSMRGSLELKKFVTFVGLLLALSAPSAQYIMWLVLQSRCPPLL